MTKPRCALPGRLRRAGLRAALAVVPLALTGCSLLLDTDGLDVADAQGPPMTHPDDAGHDDAGNDDDAAVREAAADAPHAIEAGPSDARAETAADADTDGDGGAPDSSGTRDGAGDAAADAADDHATDDAAPDAPETDGATPDAPGGGTDAGSDGCVVTTHTNGVGQTWDDCSPLGTRTRAEAQSACSALATGGGCVAQNSCNLSYVGVSLADADGGMTTYLWIYMTQNGARANTGDVLVYPSGTAQCNNLPRRTATWR